MLYGCIRRGWLTWMIARFGLFLSAYSPLFLVLAIQNGITFSHKHQSIIQVAPSAIFSCLFVLGFMAFCLMVSHGKDMQAQTITVLGTHLSGGDAVGYLSGYILPFISTPDFSVNSGVAYVIFFAVACVVTMQTDVIQINPLFFLFGYRIYSTEATFGGISKGSENRLNVVLITKRKLAVGQTIQTHELNEEVRLVA